VALEHIREWIKEGGDKGEVRILCSVRGLEAQFAAMIAAEQGMKYKYVIKILQEVMKDLGMTPTEGRTEGGIAETASAKERQAMESVGTQTETRAYGLLVLIDRCIDCLYTTEHSVAVATQTDKQMVKSIGTQSETGIEIKEQAMKSVGTQVGVVAIQTERSRVGTPECGYESAERNRSDTPESRYESARSENGGEGSSMRTYTEAASHRERPHRAREKGAPRVGAAGTEVRNDDGDTTCEAIVRSATRETHGVVSGDTRSAYPPKDWEDVELATGK